MKFPKLRPLIRVSLVYLGLFLWLSLTDPRKLPIVLLIVPFGLLFTALFMTVSLLIKRFFPGVTQVKRRITSACVAGLPSFLLLLSSVNQLTWRDVALVAFLSIFLLFYASRARFKN
ncbi:MAG: hypothetical protein ABIQ89_00230 [Candidatus Saccharimonadales bacterium]